MCSTQTLLLYQDLLNERLNFSLLFVMFTCSVILVYISFVYTAAFERCTLRSSLERVYIVYSYRSTHFKSIFMKAISSLMSTVVDVINHTMDPAFYILTRKQG